MVKSFVSRISEHVGGPAILTYLGAIISALGGLSAYMLPATIGGSVLVVFIGVVMSASSALWASVRQTQSERELRVRSDEIAELNRTIAASVTGGDSFCYLTPTLGDGTTNSPILMLVHEGEYPLYDVGIRMVNLERAAAVEEGEVLTYEMATQADTVYNPGNLSPNQARVLGSLELPNEEQQSYNVFIGARNGFVTQLIRLRHINGRWKKALKVVRDYEGEELVLLEKVDPEFPLDETGQVQW